MTPENKYDERYDAWAAVMTPPPEELVSKYNSITQEQYDEFIYYYPLYILKDMRYGQAFCEHFKISNATPLYYFRQQETCERWIHDNYLVK